MHSIRIIDRQKDQNRLKMDRVIYSVIVHMLAKMDRVIYSVTVHMLAKMDRVIYSVTVHMLAKMDRVIYSVTVHMLAKMTLLSPASQIISRRRDVRTYNLTTIIPCSI